MTSLGAILDPIRNKQIWPMCLANKESLVGFMFLWGLEINRYTPTDEGGKILSTDF